MHVLGSWDGRETMKGDRRREVGKGGRGLYMNVVYISPISSRIS